MNRKTVLVTGASHGIGKQVARVFAQAGYNVCINYNNSREEALELMHDIASDSKSGEVIVCKADVSNRNEVDKMIEDILINFGSLDVVVNNAGICEYKLFTDITYEDLQKMFNITILGSFNVIQSALKKYMLNNKQGVIINVSSMWGITGASCEVNYSTMKAGLIGMTKALAKELGPSGIRVNAVAPGVINTKMNANLTKEDFENLKSEIPLERIGTTDEVANVIKFLASDDASYITGQVISPNGGLVI